MHSIEGTVENKYQRPFSRRRGDTFTGSVDVDVTRQNASGKIGAALSEIRVQVQTHDYPQGGREIDTHMCSMTKKITVIFETAIS